MYFAFKPYIFYSIKNVLSAGARESVFSSPLSLAADSPGRCYRIHHLRFTWCIVGVRGTSGAFVVVMNVPSLNDPGGG